MKQRGRFERRRDEAVTVAAKHVLVFFVVVFFNLYFFVPLGGSGLCGRRSQDVVLSAALPGNSSSFGGDGGKKRFPPFDVKCPTFGIWGKSFAAVKFLRRGGAAWRGPGSGGAPPAFPSANCVSSFRLNEKYPRPPQKKHQKIFGKDLRRGNDVCPFEQLIVDVRRL